MSEDHLDVEIRILNVQALEPGKVYLVEMDRDKISNDQAERIVRYLYKYHQIKAITVRTHGGDAIAVRGPVEEPTT